MTMPRQGWLNDEDNMRALREELAKRPAPQARARSTGMLSKIIGLFTPKTIEILGIVVAAIGVAFQAGLPWKIGLGVAVAAYLVLRLVPKAATPFEPLESFAKVPNWPEYVFIQAATVAVAIRGGWIAGVFVVGVAIMGAGRLYSALYP